MVAFGLRERRLSGGWRGFLIGQNLRAFLGMPSANSQLLPPFLLVCARPLLACLPGPVPAMFLFFISRALSLSAASVSSADWV